MKKTITSAAAMVLLDSDEPMTTREIIKNIASHGGKFKSLNGSTRLASCFGIMSSLQMKTPDQIGVFRSEYRREVVWYAKQKIHNMDMSTPIRKWVQSQLISSPKITAHMLMKNLTKANTPQDVKDSIKGLDGKEALQFLRAEIVKTELWVWLKTKHTSSTQSSSSEAHVF